MDAQVMTAESLGQSHFGQCQFGDARLTKRAVKTAELMLRHPGGTLPQKLNAEADLDGFYRLANNPKVNHDNILMGHLQHTRDQIHHCTGWVAVIHDTSEADYSGLDIDDLGPIGNGGCRGLLLHNVLAYDLEKAEVLGLLGQFVHRRRKVPKHESCRAKREHPQRESRLWVKGVEAVGPVPEGQRWVNLMDRGPRQLRVPGPPAVAGAVVPDPQQVQPAGAGPRRLRTLAGTQAAQLGAASADAGHPDGGGLGQRSPAGADGPGADRRRGGADIASGASASWRAWR